jgi:pimeloyl-ACP methyl ester carboxylesterase
MNGYTAAQTKTIAIETGEALTYREVGKHDKVPLLLLPHFRGSLDSWDPALVDGLATNRRVIAFNNIGVASSSGLTPATVAAMAQGAVSFVSALGLDSFDLLGFSIGSFIAQEMLLTVPGLIKSAVLASSAPAGAPGMHGWAEDVMGCVGVPNPTPKGYADIFFTRSAAGLDAAAQAVKRIYRREEDRDAATSWQTRNAQYAAVCEWGEPDHARLQRVEAISAPVFVVSGDSDPMILPRYSHLLAGLIPASTLKTYPDAAHGFLFQHHAEFADDVLAFLD